MANTTPSAPGDTVKIDWKAYGAAAVLGLALHHMEKLKGQHEEGSAELYGAVREKMREKQPEIASALIKRGGYHGSDRDTLIENIGNIIDQAIEMANTLSREVEDEKNAESAGGRRRSLNSARHRARIAKERATDMGLTEDPSVKEKARSGRER